MYNKTGRKKLFVLVALLALGGIIAASVDWGSSSAADFQKLEGPIGSDKYFTIRVVDSKTGRGVPMVELKTTSQIKYYTDSAGYAAFYEPGLMDQKVFFHVKSDGYLCPQTSFGYRYCRFDIKSGGSGVVQIDRLNKAERLYRVTGMGIYRDSVELGLPVPISKPDLNCDVTGHSSVSAVEYMGRIYWFWSDTKQLADSRIQPTVYGAVSLLPKDGGLEPSVGVNLEYLKNDDGSLKPMIQRRQSDPPYAGIDSIMIVRDDKGNERLAASYTLSRSPQEPLERGIALFNDQKQVFDERIVIASSDKPLPGTWKVLKGHAEKYTDNGREYFFFTGKYPNPWPVIRVPATLDAVCDLDQYEAFTPMKEGTTKEDIDFLLVQFSKLFNSGRKAKDFEDLDKYFDLDDEKNIVWSWKKNAQPLDQEIERKFMEYGLISPSQTRFQLKDKATGEEVKLYSGSVRWNEYKKAWILIGAGLGEAKTENGVLVGDRDISKVWYAEAVSPTGPWTNAECIASHDNYNFYDPVHHSFFDEDNGRTIYFEGTYSAEHTKSERALKVPYYDYNQIMYRLKLD